MNRLLRFHLLAEWYSRQEKRTRRKVLFSIPAAALLILLLEGWLIGALTAPFDHTHSALYNGFRTAGGRKLTAAAYAVTIGVTALTLIRIGFANRAETVGSDGTLFVRRPTFGNARPMSEERMRQVYRIGNIRDITEDILGQTLNSDNGSEAVAVKSPEDSSTVLQNNCLILGASGRGKTYSQVATRMIQAARRGESVVVTDPSAELYAKTSLYFRNSGYKVFMLNLSDLSYSDCWDCITEVIDPKTERLDSGRLGTFVDVFMDNMESDKKDFWYKAERTLLRAMIGLVSWKREHVILMNLRSLYEKVAVHNDESVRTASLMTGMVSFAWIKQEIRNAAAENSYDAQDIEDCILRIEEDAPVFSMAEVVHACANFKSNEKIFTGSDMPSSHPGKMAYERYCVSKKDDVKGQILYGLNDRLSIFDDEKLRNICSNSGIVPKNIIHEKTIIYLATSSRAPETKPIASLFFTFALNDLRDEAVIALQSAVKENAPYPAIPVSLIFDEMYSVGTLGSYDIKTESYRLLPEIMSDCRKYHMTLTLILQDYGMIRQLYGKGGADTIQNNCSNMINLGVYDPESLAFLSRYSGEATVMTESHKEGGSLFNENMRVSTISEGRRYVFTEEYLKKLKRYHLIVYTNGEDPIELLACPYTAEPDYIAGKIRGESVYEAIVPLDARMASGHMRHDPFDAAAASVRADPVTGEIELPVRDLIDSLEPIRFLELDEADYTETRITDDSAQIALNLPEVQASQPKGKASGKRNARGRGALNI